MTGRLVRVPLLLLALGGCYKPPTEAWEPVRVAIHNQLTAPVTIVSGGVTYGSFGPGWKTLAFPHGATTLTWTAAPSLYSDSTPVPTDLTVQGATFSPPTDTVVITNVVSGQAYFTPVIYNLTGVAVDVAVVYNGAARLCVGLSAAATFQLSYYLLTPTVDIRVYRTATNCTGTFLAVGHATLAAYAAGSGLVLILLSTAP